MKFDFPPHKRKRVIVNSDAKNEADDQYAIVHAILTSSFELHGIIAAHFGVHPDLSAGTMTASLGEIHRLLKVMNLTGKIRVTSGAPRALPDAKTAVASAGAQLIIDEATKDDPRPLNVLFYGPLTDMASALLMEPMIAQRKIHIVWVGGAENPPHYGNEFNLSNDVHAANLVMKSPLAVSQIPYPLYGHFCVSYAELMEKVYPQGPIGKYLVEQLVEYNTRAMEVMEYRSLGDSPAVGVLMAPHAGKWSWRPAPQYHPKTCKPKRAVDRHRIRVYETFDSRFLLEDFYAKLAQFAREAEV